MGAMRHILLATIIPFCVAAMAPDFPVDHRGRWAPYSTGAYRDLGELFVTRSRMSFSSGLVLVRRRGSAVAVVADPSRVSRRVCGSLPITHVVLSRSPAESEIPSLQIAFMHGAPGPDPDFQPNSCVEYSYVRPHRP